MHLHHADLFPCAVSGLDGRTRDVGGVGAGVPRNLPAGGAPKPLDDAQRDRVRDAIDAFEDEPGVGTFRLNEHLPGVELEDSDYASTAVDRIDELVADGTSHEEITEFVNRRFDTEGRFGGVSDQERQAARDRLIGAIEAAVGMRGSGS